MASAMLARAEVVYVVFLNKNKSSSNIKTIRVVFLSACKVSIFYLHTQYFSIFLPKNLYISFKSSTFATPRRLLTVY